MITVYFRDIIDDLVELDIVDFDIIMGMNRILSCYASLNCLTKVVMFQSPNELVIDWKDNIVIPEGRFISYLKV